MQPITLRIQSDLLSELEDEADERGYSSRAEYIRQLLHQRDQIKQTIDSDQTVNSLDSGAVVENSNRIERVSSEVEELRTRIAELEEIMERPAEQTSKHDDSMNDTIDEQYKQESQEMVSTGDMDELTEWLENHGPESDDAHAIILNAAELLLTEGPLSAGEIKERLYQSHPNAYGSANALWGATIGRVYEDAPGFSKPEYGTYDYTT